MTNYKLKILRNGEPVANYDVAINILNTFEGHYIGQPIAILYFDEEQNRRVILAMGRRDCETEQIEGRNYGPEFYDIINDKLEEVTFKYISSYPLTTVIKSSVGGISEGITLFDLLHETNGDISRILDMMFFEDATIHPVVRDPEITSFTYRGQEEVTLDYVPRIEDFTYELDYGFVSYGKNELEEIVTDVEYAGASEEEILILDINENELLEPPTLGDYIYRLRVTFDEGTITPLNSDGTVFKTPYPGGVYYKDVLVHIVQSIYVGLVDVDAIENIYNDYGSPTSEQAIQYCLDNNLLHNFPSSTLYKLTGNDKWGMLLILTPQSCSCKYNGDTELAHKFGFNRSVIEINDIVYNAFYSNNVWFTSTRVQVLDSLIYYSSDESYFYEITERELTNE